MLPLVIRGISLVVAVAGLVGAGLAARANHTYLASRLIALFGAAVPAAIFSGRFAAVLKAQSRPAWIVLALIGALLMCALATAIFPRQFFHAIAHFMGHVPRPR